MASKDINNKKGVKIIEWKINLDWAESDLRSGRRVGQADRPTTSSHSISLAPVTKRRSSCVKISGHKKE
jgi:hypothetical protein